MSLPDAVEAAVLGGTARGFPALVGRRVSGLRCVTST